MSLISLQQAMDKLYYDNKKINERLTAVDTKLQWYIDNGFLPPYGQAPLIPKMTGNATPSGVASADSIYDSTRQPYNAFDMDENTHWQTKWQEDGTLTYQFPNPVKANRIYLYVTKYITSWTLKASNDNAQWTTLASGSDTSDDTKVFDVTFENDTSYKYYKLECSKYDGHVQIRIMQLYSML